MSEELEEEPQQEEEWGEEERQQLWTQEFTEEEPEEEPETPQEDEPEPTIDDRPKHDWEKRYNDLRPEFDRRGNKIHELEKANESSRLEALELKQRMLELESRVGNQRTEEKPQDPYADETYFSEEDRQTIEDYPEIYEIAAKEAKRQAALQAKALKDEYEQRLSEIQTRVDTTSQSFEEQERIRLRNNHHKAMVDGIGDVYLEIDKDPAFHEFVNSTPMYYNAMTSSMNPNDHVLVMKHFLASEGGQRYRQSKPQSNSNQNRRDAASGFVSNSAPVRQNTKSMSRTDLWDSITVE